MEYLLIGLIVLSYAFTCALLVVVIAVYDKVNLLLTNEKITAEHNKKQHKKIDEINKNTLSIKNFLDQIEDVNVTK